MKLPDACNNLWDVRCEIDRLDSEIINLLAQRLAYVLAAAQFKKSEEDIPAPERVKAMLVDRRGWAKDAGLDECFIQEIFEQITRWYIATQIKHWREMNKQAKGDRHD